MKSTQDAPTVSPSAPPAPLPPAETTPVASHQPAVQPREIGGRDGPDPTRFGDWEKAGRCIDF